MTDRELLLELRRGYLTQLRAIDKALGIHSSYRVERDPPARSQMGPEAVGSHQPHSDKGDLRRPA